MRATPPVPEPGSPLHPDSARVHALRCTPSYECAPPFDPAERYPEYRGGVSDANSVYSAVRDLFVQMRLDAEQYGSPSWNPLGGLVRPGNRVVLKPNLIAASHRVRRNEWEYVITHGSVVRAVLDYVLIALRGEGEVWIADGPQFDSDWREISRRSGLESLVGELVSRSRVPIRLLDLRAEWWPDGSTDVTETRHPLPGDPAGSQMIDVGTYSSFIGHSGVGKYYGSDYDQAETNRHHSGGRHEYLVSRTCTSADVFINIPKMKTHKKVGVTLALKNLVGINTGRNWLPHHTDGSPHDGGDGFPQASLARTTELAAMRRFERWTFSHPKYVAPVFRLVKRLGKRILGESGQVVRQGNWYGNDTCWRMVHDINRCLLFNDGSHFPSFPAKRYMAVVDGIVAGDGDGPACPDPVPAGLLVAGFNPVAVDAASAWLMGFDPKLLPVIARAFESAPLPLVGFAFADISLSSNFGPWNGPLDVLDAGTSLRLRAHPGWSGRIEFDRGVESPEPPQALRLG